MSKSEPKKELYCHFCGKLQHEIRKLIAGPTSYICDECVVLCMDIITDEEAKRGTSYGKFLAFHKRKPNSLERFNSFFKKGGE